MAFDENFFTPVTDADLTDFQPDANASDVQTEAPSTPAIDENFFKPVGSDELNQFHSPESSAGLRQRLQFNLQNDYAPDQGNLYDQAILGVGEGLARVPGQVGGLARFFGAPEVGQRLSRYSQNKVNEYEDLADATGTSPVAQTTHGIAEEVGGVAPMAAAAAVGGMPAAAITAGLQTLGSTEQEAANTYEQRGLTPEEATAKARLPAAVAGVTSALINYFVPGGANKLLGNLTEGLITKTAAGAILKDALLNALSLGGMSAADTGTQGVIAKATYDPERTLKEILLQSVQAGASGAGLGLALSAPHLFVRGASEAIRTAREAWSGYKQPEAQPGADAGAAAEQPAAAAPGAEGASAEPHAAPQPQFDTFGDPRSTPVSDADRPRAVLAQKILRAAGFSDEFANEAAQHFVGAFEPDPNEGAEDFRTRLFGTLKSLGAQPEEQIGRTRRDEQGNPLPPPARVQALRDAQAVKNAAALAQMRAVAMEAATRAQAQPQAQPAAAAQPEAPVAQAKPPVEQKAAESAKVPFEKNLVTIPEGGDLRGQKEIQKETYVPQGLITQPIAEQPAPLTLSLNPVASRSLPAAPPALPEAAAPSSSGPKFDWEASTPIEGVKVAGHYDVVDAKDIVTSFDRGFDQSLQPRDRTRGASQQQILSISTRLDPNRLGAAPTTDFGAPIIDDSNQVLSGNGRASALRNVFDHGGAPSQAYRAWIAQNAAEFGIDPAKLASIKNPVLVRRISDYGGLTKQQFAEQSNRQQVFGKGEGESAAADARMLAAHPQLMDSFLPSETGDVLAASNREFLNAFIQGTGDQATLLGQSGYNGPALRKRVRNAILGTVLGPDNRQTLTTLIERGEELGVANVVNGLISASPSLVKLLGSQYDLTAPLAKAAQDLIRVKSEGQKVSDFLSQNDLFGDSNRSAESDFLLTKLATAKSAVAVAEPLNKYAQRAIRIDTTTPDIFGATNATRGEILRHAYESGSVSARPQENFSFGKPSAVAEKSKPTGQAPYGSVRPDGASAAESAGAQPLVGRSVDIPTAHALIDQHLPPESRPGMHAALDVLAKSGLDTSNFILELTKTSENGLAGSYQNGIVRLAIDADPRTGPEEVFHMMVESLPAKDRAALEAERLENLPADAPAALRSGTMSTKEFQASGLPIKWYPWINAYEYAANRYSEATTDEAMRKMTPEQRSLWQRIKDWFAKIWDALKVFVRDPAASDRIKKAMDDGTQKYDPARAMASDELRGKFVTKRSEAESAVEFAKGAQAKKIEGEEFLAQVDVPVKLMEKHGVPELPGRVRRALGFSEAKGIQEIGVHSNGAHEDYYAIRDRSEPWLKQRLGVYAYRHAVAFTARLNEAVTDGAAARVDLNSPEIRDEINEMRSRHLSALFYEQAFKNAQVAIKTALNEALELLKQERTSDLRQAQLEAQIRTLKDVGESRVALQRLLDDMTSVMLSTPQGEWILKNGGTSEDVGKIYRDIKRSTGQTIVGDQMIGVASYLLSRMSELRNQLLAAEYAKQNGPLAAAWAKLKTLMDQMEKNPAATIEKMMRQREKLAADATAAEFIFRQMEKELTRKLDTIYTRIKAGEVAQNLLADPEWQKYVGDVQRDAGAYGTKKPWEPFIDSGPGSFYVTPDNEEVGGLSLALRSGNPESVNQAYRQAQRHLKIYDQWLDKANPDDPYYDKFLIERNTIRDYWGDVALLVPNHRDDPLGWTLTSIDRTITLAGGRVMPQARKATRTLNALAHATKPWTQKSIDVFQSDWTAGIRSHGVKWNNLRDRDLPWASGVYIDHIQEVANRAQFRGGALSVGDRTMKGWVVTKEDLKVIQNQSLRNSEAYKIVKRWDRQVTEDTEGGVTIYREASPVTETTLPRVPNYDRIPELEPVASAFEKYQTEKSEAALGELVSALQATWSSDGDGYIGQRESDFAHFTIFDGEGGAFEKVADEIRNGSAMETFDKTAQRFAEVSGRPIEEVRQTMAVEFGRIATNAVNKLKTDLKPGEPTILGGDPTNSFTKERGKQLGPWTYYRTGWSSVDDVRATGGHMISVAQARVLTAMEAQLSDLKRTAGQFKQRVTDLSKGGESSPGEKAISENIEGQRRRKTFDDWYNLTYRLKELTDRINEIKTHTTPNKNMGASYVIDRYVQLGVRTLIAAYPSTMRNVGVVYPYRAMYAMGNGQIHSILATLGLGSRQTAKMLVNGYVISVLKLPILGIVGFAKGIQNSLKGKGISEVAFKSIVREWVKELAISSPKRIKEVREMEEAGVHIPSQTENEYNNQVSEAMYREVTRPDQKLSWKSKLALGPAVVLESTVLAAANAGNPSMGDAVVNSIAWSLMNSVFSPNVVFKRKASVLLKRLEQGYYRSLRSFGLKQNVSGKYDLENPSAPKNVIDPWDLNVDGDQLSRWRTSFAQSGMNFDAKMIDFVKRLKENPDAEFLNRDDVIALTNWAIEQYNRQSPTNQPKVFTSNNAFVRWFGVLLPWQTRALTQFIEFFSIPRHVPFPDASSGMIKMQKMAQWFGKLASALVIGYMVGGVSELALEGMVRGYRRIAYHQISSNRLPWEHETKSGVMLSALKYPVQSTPLLAMPLTSMLPGGTSRNTFNLSFVGLEKTKDVASWVSYGLQTGNWWYKTPATAAGFYQDIKAITSRTQPGLTLRKNVEALVQRFGPEDKVRKPDYSTPSNLSAVSPYGQALWDAAYRGDMAAVRQVAQEAMRVAKQAGKPDPRKTVEDMFHNGNFMSAALSSLPTQTEYFHWKAKLSASDKAMVDEAMRNYRRAATTLGFNPPNFFRADEVVMQQQLRRRENQQPIGVSRLSRR